MAYRVKTLLGVFAVLGVFLALAFALRFGSRAPAPKRDPKFQARLNIADRLESEMKANGCPKCWTYCQWDVLVIGNPGAAPNAIAGAVTGNSKLLASLQEIGFKKLLAIQGEGFSDPAFSYSLAPAKPVRSKP